MLRGNLERAAPSGVFVAPGALGLAFGIAYGALPVRGPTWPLLALVAFALVAALRYRDVEIHSSDKRRIKPAARFDAWAIGLLLVSIAVRSLVGMSAAKGYPRTDLLVIGLPVSAFLGKCMGGYLADCLGWTETSVGALLLFATIGDSRKASIRRLVTLAQRQGGAMSPLDEPLITGSGG